jgi:hypothetical protein
MSDYPEDLTIEEPKPQQLKELKDRHRVAAQMLIGGARVKDVAMELSVEPVTIYRWQQDPLFNAYKMELERELREQALDQLSLKIAHASRRTFDTIDHIMQHGKSDNVRLRAAEMFLDRQAPKVVKNQNENTNTLKIEGLQEVMQTMREVTGITQQQMEGLTDGETLKLIEESVIDVTPADPPQEATKEN